MNQDFIAPLIVSIFGILGLASVIGTRYYKLNSKYLRIKSSKKLFCGQEILNLCGVCFVGAVPFLFLIGYQSLVRSFFVELLSNPIAIICFLIVILCPIAAVLLSIYLHISNLVKSFKSNFIKEIVLCRKNNYIKVCSNLGVTVISYDDIISFSVNITTTAVPNVRPVTNRRGIIGIVDVITDIEIVILTVNDGVIKINTLGNIMFDSNSQKLLEAILEYKTKFKNFIFNNN